MSSRDEFGFFERLLYRVAFAHPVLQRRIGELEDDLFSKELAAIDPSRAVFITGLPRAGTTLVLKILYATGEFATLTYRSMPFVLAPVLWHQISRPFAREGTRRERDHGDGVEISPDSPEAFEEVLWLNRLGESIVGERHLSVLRGSDVPEHFYEALRQLMRKVIHLQARVSGVSDARYLSKNNANLARLPALAATLPDASVLVPFREPFAHAQSLLRQHENFLQRHEQDDFARRYMRWIGHYDFGLNFRPIRFDDDAPPGDGIEHTDIRFWLRYWVQAYRFALAHKRQNVHFVDYDALLSQPTAGLGAIGEAIGLRDTDRLIGGRHVLRPPTTAVKEIPAVEHALETDVREVVERLRASALPYDRAGSSSGHDSA